MFSLRFRNSSDALYGSISDGPKVGHFLSDPLLAKTSSIDLEEKVAGFNSIITGPFCIDR
jgi:hypothetical protein